MAAVLLVAALLIAVNMKKGYPLFGRVQRQLDRLNEVAREFVYAVRVAKAFGAEMQEKALFSGAAGALGEANVAAMRVPAVFTPLINLTVNLGVVAPILLYRPENAGGIGWLMASVNYMTQVPFALGTVSNILNASLHALASSERVNEILTQEAAQAQPERPRIAWGDGAIWFEDVHFAYNQAAQDAVAGVSLDVRVGETIGIIGPTGSGKSTLVSLIPRFYDATKGRVLVDGLDDIDLVIPSGTRVNVVGPTGAGKTTLINLLTRFYDVTGGRILLDGRDLRDYRMSDLRRAFGVVLQDASLFGFSAGDNIRLRPSGGVGRARSGGGERRGRGRLHTAHAQGLQNRAQPGRLRAQPGEQKRITIARAVLADGPF